ETTRSLSARVTTRMTQGASRETAPTIAAERRGMDREERGGSRGFDTPTTSGVARRYPPPTETRSVFRSRVSRVVRGVERPRPGRCRRRDLDALRVDAGR